MRVLSFESLQSEKGIVYSRDHLRKLIKQGKFPKPIEIGNGRLAWVEEEIDAMLKARAAARDSQERPSA